MNSQENAAFFDDLASRWDSLEDIPLLHAKLRDGLRELAVGTDERILDIGCGTGNIVIGMLPQLSARARIAAIDVSPGMLAIAVRKCADPRVLWQVADAYRLPFAAGVFDRVFCCSVWPHFSDPTAIARELYRVLHPGGYLHIWHFQPRCEINHIHAGAGADVANDILAPATVTAASLQNAGFAVAAPIDDDQQYRVTGRKSAVQDTQRD